MSSPADVDALERRLDHVHEHVIELRARLAGLESSIGGHLTPSPTPALVRAPKPAAVVTRRSAGARAPRAAQPRSAVSTGPARASAPAAAPSSAPPVRSGDTLAQPQVAEELEDASPIWALAAAGGAALLLGLICLAIYAIEQDWLSPGLRFAGSLLLSAALTCAAWPIARRGHESVAGAIGGAGLGAWMASWLFARHVHELASGGQVFLALAAGAGACLLIADRLRLRLMAILAALAACATPVLVGAGRGSLGELMGYQLAVVALLMLVDWRRRWPELPTIALMATWLLGGRWAALGFEPSEAGSFMVWTCAVLLASAVSTWRALIASADAIERGHARARLLAGGLLSWAAAAWVFAAHEQTLALVTLAFAGWHGLLAWVLQTRTVAEPGESSAAAEAGGADRFASVLFGLTWLQLLVAGPLMFTGATLAWWWIAMAVGAVAMGRQAESAARWAMVSPMRSALILAPALAAVLLCLGKPGAGWSLSLAMCAALVPLVGSFVLRAASDSQPGVYHRPHPQLALLSTLLWIGLALGVEIEPVSARLILGLVPIALVAGWACVKPSPVGLTLAGVELGVGGFALLVAIGLSDAINPTRGLAADSWGLALVAASLGVLSWGLVVRGRELKVPVAGEQAPDRVSLGLLGAACLGLSMALGASAWVMDIDASLAMAHLGHTLAIAFAGLGLLSAGLRGREESWRQLGLTAICCAAGKVVFFDLAGAAFVWRALSFAGIGVVFIAGAFAYSRARLRQRTA